MKLRQRHIAVSVFLLIMGILFLLNNFRILKDIDFNFIFFLWPFIIIFASIYILLRGKKITFYITALNSVITALVIFSAIVVYGSIIPFLPKIETGRLSKINPNITIHSESENLFKNLDKANLVFKSERGEFYLRGTTDRLTEYETKTTFGEYLYNRSEKDGVQTIDLRFDPERIPWKVTSEKNSIDLKLNPKPLWNLDYDLSTASFDADLGYYKVSQLRLNLSRATNATINIGENTVPQKMEIILNSSTSTTELRVPKDIGIEVKVKSGFSSLDLSDFNRIENYIYQSNNFDNAEKKIYISGEINFSNFKINRF